MRLSEFNGSTNQFLLCSVLFSTTFLDAFLTFLTGAFFYSKEVAGFLPMGHPRRLEDRPGTLTRRRAYYTFCTLRFQKQSFGLNFEARLKHSFFRFPTSKLFEHRL